MHATYFIPRENEDKFTAKIGQLAKRAKKIGCVAILFAAVKTLALPRTRRFPDGYDEEGNTRYTYREVLVEHVAYTISGEAPSLNGWEFVGTIEHTDGVNLLRTFTDEAVPAVFRKRGPEHCDHCGMVRGRKDTFIVKNTETGEYKQVGRSCMRDFLGHKSPGAVAALATLLIDFEESLAGGEFEDDSGGSSRYESYALAGFLAMTSAVISMHGWVSRSEAKESYIPKAPTADIVLSELNPYNKEKSIKTVPEAAYEEAREAIEWVTAQDSAGNDYIHNLQAIVEIDYVTGRTAGYAASIVSSYRRATERQLRATVLKADGTDHVGTVGKRQEFLLTLLAVYVTEGYYGTSYIHKFADHDGNQVTWFASNDECVPASEAHPDCRNWSQEDIADGLNGSGHKVPMVKGATYRVAATVKDHGEYNGQAQTKVARITVKDIAPKPKRRRKAKTVAAVA